MVWQNSEATQVIAEYVTIFVGTSTSNCKEGLFSSSTELSDLSSSDELEFVFSLFGMVFCK